MLFHGGKYRTHLYHGIATATQIVGIFPGLNIVTIRPDGGAALTMVTGDVQKDIAPNGSILI